VADFQIECFQNQYLPEGATVMNAVISVTAQGAGAVTPDGSGDGGIQPRAEVIIVDTSGSMSGRKLREAKAATCAAIDCLPEGVRFAVVSGNHEAELAYPRRPSLAVVSSSTRTKAKDALTKLEAGGGTAMGTWIQLAADLLRDEPGIRHAILLTDGKNESEAPEDLDRVLAEAEGVFQCDCRGVGSDYEVAEVRKVASALLGTDDIVPDPAGLTEDFASMMEEALSRRIPEVGLRVWAPQVAQVILVKQMDPVILDLTGTRVESGPVSGDYKTGAWGDETRDYHLRVRVPPGNIGDEAMLAARVMLVVGGDVVGEARVFAEWTSDTARSTRINRRVAEVMGQTELADALQEGVEAQRAGDTSTATDRLGRAVSLASESGNSEAIALLERLVDIEDAATGRVRPRAKVDDMDLQIAEAKSQRTTRTGRGRAG
jgi:uncharacterized protein YegL